MGRPRILTLSSQAAREKDFHQRLAPLDFDFQVCPTSDLAVACQQSKIALILICGPLQSSELAALQHQSAVTPYIPILHLDHRGPRLTHSSLLYRKLKPSVHTAGIERHIRELCSLAHVLRDRDRLYRVSRLVQHFDQGLDTLEFKSVISNFFTLLQQESGAENVIWISLRQDEVTRERAGATQWQPLSSRPTHVDQLDRMASWLRDHRDAVTEKGLSIIHPEFVGDDLITGAYLHRSESVLLFVNASDQTQEATLSIIPYVDSVIARSLQYSEMRELTYIDDLTDLYNQRYLYRVLNIEIQRSQRSHSKFCILFIDADGLKKINDQHGHLVGSRLITELGRIVKETCRASDFGFRYGGDEYIIILTDTDLSQAEKVAERIRARVEKTTFEVQDLCVNLTLSIGVAGFPEHAQTPEQIVAMADRAMYNAKKKSKNVVYIAS